MHYRLQYLSAMSGHELKAAFAMIPAEVTSLDLSKNGFGEKTGAELAKVFAAIPLSVTSLDLSQNRFGQKTGAELAKALAAIPLGVTSLYLGTNALYRITGTELAKAFAAIPLSVTSLYLSANDFHKKTAAELAMAFAAIPLSVKSLNLSWNYFLDKTGNEIAAVFRAIPASVTSLDLSSNFFGDKSAAELAMAFAAIPLSVKSLNLSGNLFHNKTGDEIATVFRAIPASVTLLDLSGNGLNNKTDAEWIGLFSSLPYVHTVMLENRTVNKYQLFADQLLAQIEQLVLKDLPALVTQIIPDFEIDEIALCRIIEVLEKKKTSTAYLVCAMLLDDSIQNMVRGKGPENQEKYDEKRSHDAVTFYLKSLNNKSSPAIQDMISFKLWENKTVGNPAPSLLRRLGEFDIHPPEKFVPHYRLFDQSGRGSCISLRNHEEPKDDVESDKQSDPRLRYLKK